jgi:hypothetical protein
MGAQKLFLLSVIIDKLRAVQSPPYRPAQTSETNDLHPVLQTLMQQCWAEQPSDRPSFDEINKVIRGINKGK